MIYVGIDIAKDKHDCYIVTSDGILISDNLRITNTLEGFNTLYSIISSNYQVANDVRIGLESTGHYGINLENFLRTKGYQIIVFNPLAVASFRKSQTLRKTNKVDAKVITTLLFNSEQAPTALVSDEIRELKSLTRHRYRLIRQCTKLKVSVSRLVVIRDPTFKLYQEKKKSEGKHYYVAISHTSKKLLRVIFHLLKNNINFVPQN